MISSVTKNNGSRIHIELCFLVQVVTYCFVQVTRLIYTNSGVALLALASNALHKLWKWPRNERNPSGKVMLLIWKEFLCASEKIVF